MADDQPLDWDDLRFFLAVYRQGSLSAAAHSLKVSQPTVGRRLTAFETQLGARLFDRTPSGFLPTATAAELAPLAEAMESSADALSRRRAAANPIPSGTVRLAMWEALAEMLCPHLPELQARLPDIRFELAINHQAANLSRREADILLRDRLPENPALIVRNLGRAAAAAYGSKAYIEASPDALTEARAQACAWVGYDDDHAYFLNQAWLLRQLDGKAPALRVNNAMVLREAVRAGVGLGVLACAVGDADPALVRASPPIPELERDIFLIVHPDLRRSAAVRAVSDALAGLFRRKADFFLGGA